MDIITQKPNLYEGAQGFAGNEGSKPENNKDNNATTKNNALLTPTL